MKIEIPKLNPSATSIPFSAAVQVIESSSEMYQILHRTQQQLVFLLKNADGSTFRSKIDHKLAENALRVFMQCGQPFTPSPEFEKFKTRVGRCLRLILERQEAALPGYTIAPQKDSRAYMQYVVPIDYAPLTDAECMQQVSTALIQCSKAVSLMYAVIADTVEHQSMPSPKRCLISMRRGYAFFLSPPAARQASGRPQ